jgi:hypothetical protein
MVLVFVLLNFFLTSFMTGLIWLVQCVHYPSFHFISDQEFINFCQFHSRSISLIVLPVMLIELTTSFLLWWFTQEQLLLIAFILNILLFATTFLISVPCHQELKSGKNEKFIKKLVLTNWYRTLLWTGRSAIIARYLWLISL